MPQLIDDQFWIDQVEALKLQLLDLNSHITAILTGAQEYRLNTGQTTQNVRRADLEQLKSFRGALMNEMTTLEAKVCGTGRHGRPAF